MRPSSLFSLRHGVHQWSQHHDLELVAVVFALKIWRHYLFREKCYIFTDYKILKYLLTKNELNLRHHRWVELLKDYECVIDYHPKKANIVVDSLSHNSMTDLRSLLARISLTLNRGLVAELWVESELVRELKELQATNERLMAKAERVRRGKILEFDLKDRDVLYFLNRLCVSANTKLKARILGEAHYSPLSVHLRGDKMYKQRVKSKHQVPSGLL
ncbi:uncharacterized protein LOC120193282 [Hibiscus syriacus]|uniref:uncharacterized protein LOC120193282 n=1 Tax=Hibiscus syriacus TaxID=106335 RepID=UPI0019206E2D|nr:uncharacterized protein LOC120193282 [Hibiscus syriacus]